MRLYLSKQEITTIWNTLHEYALCRDCEAEHYNEEDAAEMRTEAERLRELADKVYAKRHGR